MVGTYTFSNMQQSVYHMTAFWTFGKCKRKSGRKVSGSPLNADWCGFDFLKCVLLRQKLYADILDVHIKNFKQKSFEVKRKTVPTDIPNGPFLRF